MAEWPINDTHDGDTLVRPWPQSQHTHTPLRIHKLHLENSSNFSKFDAPNYGLAHTNSTWCYLYVHMIPIKLIQIITPFSSVFLRLDPQPVTPTQDPPPRIVPIVDYHYD